MKLDDLCMISNAKMVIYEGYFGIEIARIDGKNGCTMPLLCSDIGYISVVDDWMHIEVDFSVYGFIDNNWRQLKDLIINDYIKFSLLESSKGIFSMGKTKVIHRLTTPDGQEMYSVDNMVYTTSEFKQYVISDNEYLLHITKNWANYEAEWDL